MLNKQPIFLVDDRLTSYEMLMGVGEVVTYKKSPLERLGQTKPDALFIRSVTKIDQELLQAFPTLRRIYTATAGLDHINLALCDRADIEVRSAPGHNAQAVADWVWSSLFAFAAAEDAPLEGHVLGIVGAGHTGTAVGARAKAHGLDVLYYDPPRQERDPSFQSASWAALSNASFISFHVPLELEGKWPTREMADLGDFGVEQWIFNASRGEVLSRQKGTATPRCLALDVFPGEPNIPQQWVRDAQLASPHAGGNTHEAKWNATRYLAAQAIADYATDGDPETLPIQPVHRHPGELILRKGESAESAFSRVLNHWTDLQELSSHFRAQILAARTEDIGDAFRSVRKRSRRFALQGRSVSSDCRIPQDWVQRLSAHGVHVAPEGQGELRIIGEIPSFLSADDKRE